MRMNEFAKIIKESSIAGNNKADIIYWLLQAAGAKDAVNKNSENSSNRSPSVSTINKWLSNKGGKPGVSRYFPNLKIESKETAHKFLKNTARENQWMELRDSFKKWHDDHNTDKDFYINTETEDFIIFSTSFWRQFASFFDSLGIWDEGEEKKASQTSIGNKMITTFKETFRQYEVYRFVPENIEHIISSLGIYKTILDENNELKSRKELFENSDNEFCLYSDNKETESTQQCSLYSDDADGNKNETEPHQSTDSEQFEKEDSRCSSMQILKKMYCKYFPSYNCFTFYAVDKYKSIFKLETEGECIFLKFGEQFNFDEMPTNVWMLESFQYDNVNPSSLEEKFDEILWKNCQGEIMIVEIALDTDDSIIKDCYTIIDEMLKSESSIDEFTIVIDEKIVKKFENINFDNNARLIYNNIKQYVESLKNFKEYLTRFKELKKEKSDYLDERDLKEQFSVYSYFHVRELQKPKYPFSECYLNPEEADIVMSKLRYYHKSLMELYAEIFSYEEDYPA